MDINQEYLDVTTALARKMVKQLGVSTKIESTTDRRRALEGSDYVISVILLHGLEARMVEHKIQRKYGVDQAVGCTTGPGGVFHALRYIPVMLDICREHGGAMSRRLVSPLRQSHHDSALGYEHCLADQEYWAVP